MAPDPPIFRSQSLCRSLPTNPKIVASEAVSFQSAGMTSKNSASTPPGSCFHLGAQRSKTPRPRYGLAWVELLVHQRLLLFITWLWAHDDKRQQEPPAQFPWLAPNPPSSDLQSFYPSYPQMNPKLATQHFLPKCRDTYSKHSATQAAGRQTLNSFLRPR